MEELLVLTTAPAAYDYAHNIELSANCGEYDGKLVRMVLCSDDFRRDYQIGRNFSGWYYTRRIGETKQDIELGLFEPNDDFFNRGAIAHEKANQ